ncbi:MAG TPA: insulinase family protein [Polyangiaceae bacterium]|nr:insulinase family protein [Polyangiaceae bacterium]
MKPAFHLKSGVPVFLETSHALPLVDVDVIVLRGGLLDPKGLGGLSRFTASMMRRGPRGTSSEVFDERLDALGATLSISVGHESMRVQGSVLTRNLGPFLSELGRVMVSPALRRRDFDWVRQASRAQLRALQDHDGALVGRAFRRALFRGHGYARPLSGTEESLERLTLAEVKAHHKRLIRAPHLLIGLAGDVRAEEAERLLGAAFSRVLDGATRRPPRRAAKMRQGIHAVLVDKPQRTQAQVQIGTLGLAVGHKDHPAMLVGNTAFGGTFTSRLMKEVRGERGWSYGAYSKLSTDRQREAWQMWTQPAAEQLLDCVALQLELYQDWLERGLSRAEVQGAKRYLIKSQPFDLETAGKRLEPKLQTAANNLPEDWFATYPKRLRAVNRARVNTAVREHLSATDLTVAVLATATPAMERSLRSLPGVRSLTVLPFDMV